jgi:hypothetical protein
MGGHVTRALPQKNMEDGVKDILSAHPRHEGAIMPRFFKYDVSLSFAGEQRTYATALASFLVDHGLRVYIDDADRSRIWGNRLSEELDRIYRVDSRCVVVFISSDYGRKQWTMFELKSCLSTAFASSEKYVLPVRFDNTQLEGVNSDMVYVDATDHDPASLGAIVQNKLAEIVRSSEEVSLMDQEFWRVTDSRYGTSSFLSSAARHVDLRWSRAGSPVVYAAGSECSAVLEFVASNVSRPFGGDRSYVLFGAKISVLVPTIRIEPINLVPKWRNVRDKPDVLKRVTDHVIRQNICVASVPSPILPSQETFIINQNHEAFGQFHIFANIPLDLAYIDANRLSPLE